MFLFAQIFLYITAMREWRREREMLLQMAEIERQRLLDRIQARDLPEYKAVQPQPKSTPKEPRPEKDELIPL
jgi:hypothetical protein